MNVREWVDDERRGATGARFLYAVGLLLLASGCITIPGRDGAKHHIVIGFGVVTVKETADPAVVATHVNALGVSVSDRPGLRFGLGWSDSIVVSVPNKAENVLVEASRRPFGPLIVNCPSAVLSEEPSEGVESNDDESDADAPAAAEPDGDQ